MGTVRAPLGYDTPGVLNKGHYMYTTVFPPSPFMPSGARVALTPTIHTPPQTGRDPESDPESIQNILNLKFFCIKHLS